MENSMDEIVAELQSLSPNQRECVLEFVHSLKAVERKGTPGRRLLRFAGTIPKDDLALMEAVIEQECERIDDDGW